MVKPSSADEHTESILSIIEYRTIGSYCMFSSVTNQRTIGPENAHLKPDLGVLSHNEMTLTLNTHTPLLTS